MSDFKKFEDEDDFGDKKVEMKKEDSLPGFNLKITKKDADGDNNGNDDTNYTEVVSSSIMGNITKHLE